MRYNLPRWPSEVKMDIVLYPIRSQCKLTDHANAKAESW